MSVLTVTVPAANFQLTELATLKADLGIATSDTANDAALGRMIDAASAALARYCDRVFAVETVREVFDPRRSEAIMLARYPVVEITEMTLAGETVDVDDIEFDQESPFIWRLDTGTPPERISWGCSRAVVTYRGGYLLPGDEADEDVSDLPADLEQAALMLSARLWHGAGRDATVRGLQYSDGSRVDYGFGMAANASGMPADIAIMVNRYRRLTV